jgi:lycopene cyclase domain-containing protein
MTYTLLAVTAVILAAAADQWVLRTRLLRSRNFWIAYAILLVFQLMANGVLTGLHIVRYSPAAILGLRVAYAPVEDLAFGLALITFTLCCWVRLTSGAAASSACSKRPARPATGSADPPPAPPGTTTSTGAHRGARR